MKKLILLSTMLMMFCLTSFSQNATEVDDSFIYCEIVGRQKLFSNKINISMDYGQFNKFGSNQTLVDANGETKIFNSMVDAMNWMGNDGWEFVQAYTIGDSKSGYVYHWLLKMDSSKLSPEDIESIKADMKTKRGFKDENKN